LLTHELVQHRHEQVLPACARQPAAWGGPSESDAEIFEGELTWMLMHQVFSFNSPSVQRQDVHIVLDRAGDVVGLAARNQTAVRSNSRLRTSWSVGSD
jgi:hypothetical protein